MSRKRFVIEIILNRTRQSLTLVAEFLLAALRSVEGKTFHKLLSVPVQDQTPNDVCALGAKSFSEATPSILRFPEGETRMRNGSLTPTFREEEQRLHQHLNPAGFN